ncbi:MAG: hypothetical protein R2849_09485 [Thermomicrobiales bacterium]
MLNASIVPASWHFYLLSVGAMLALAGLDFLGAIFAKSGPSVIRLPSISKRAAAFLLLFAVYAVQP